MRPRKAQQLHLKRRLALSGSPGRATLSFLVSLLLLTSPQNHPSPGYPLHLVPLSRRKTVVAAQIEIIHFVKHYGINNCGFLTLRCPSTTNLKKAQSFLNNASRRFLKELFPAWIAMVEFDHYDRPHFHLLVATRHDFRTGFDFTRYDQMKAIGQRAYRERRALTTAEKCERGCLARNLTANPALRALWKQLREKLPKFGFSKKRPAELMPIQKNAVAIAVYLTTQFLYPDLCEFIPRGARIFRTSASCPRVIPRISHLVIDTPARRRYLKYRERICGILGGLTHAQMAHSFGRRWAYRCVQICMALDDEYGRNQIPWHHATVLALTEEIMVNGYVRPSPEDPLAHLWRGRPINEVSRLPEFGISLPRSCRRRSALRLHISRSKESGRARRGPPGPAPWPGRVLESFSCCHGCHGRRPWLAGRAAGRTSHGRPCDSIAAAKASQLHRGSLLRTLPLQRASAPAAVHSQRTFSPLHQPLRGAATINEAMPSIQMKNETKLATAKPVKDRASDLRETAANIRAELELLALPPQSNPEPVRSRLIRPDDPVIVSAAVSTYLEAQPGRGTFAVRLSLDDATITTTVSLGDCDAFSLRCAAQRGAKRILGSLLSLARTSKHLANTHYVERSKKSAANAKASDAPGTTSESFWISEVRTDGAPDFTPDAWNVEFELESSAAFAEFAFHED